MRESYVWRMIVWTFVVTGLVMLVARFDPGFLSVFGPVGVIPVSTGERIEVLVGQNAPFADGVTTDLYFREADGSFSKVETFGDSIQCVSTVGGELFVTFAKGKAGEGGGASSFYKDGKWVKSASAPMGFTIIDTAGYDGSIYAQGPTEDGKGIELRRLSQEGWQQVGEAFDTGGEYVPGGIVATDAGLVVCYSPEVAVKSRQDIKDLRWYYVIFDGSTWGKARELVEASGRLPQVCSYDGKTAFLITDPAHKDNPVEMGIMQDETLDIVAQIPTKDRGLIVGAWLVALGAEKYVYLVGPGKCWEVRLEGFAPQEAVMRLGGPGGSAIRTRIYVGVIGAGAVLMVALGVTWFVMRVRNITRKKAG